MEDEDIIGQEVVAIAYITFMEIGIYGMGKLVEDTEDHYIVELLEDEDKGPIRIECDTIVPIGRWASFVDETNAKVKRILYKS